NAMVAAAMTLKLNVSKPPSGQIVRVDALDPLLSLGRRPRTTAMQRARRSSSHPATAMQRIPEIPTTRSTRSSVTLKPRRLHLDAVGSPVEISFSATDRMLLVDQVRFVDRATTSTAVAVCKITPEWQASKATHQHRQPSRSQEC